MNDGDSELNSSILFSILLHSTGHVIVIMGIAVLYCCHISSKILPLEKYPIETHAYQLVQVSFKVYIILLNYKKMVLNIS